MNPTWLRPLRRTLAYLLLAILFAMALVMASTSGASHALSTAAAADVDGIAGAPASETGADGRSRFSYQAGAGQQLSDFYLVRNTGTTQQVMHVFATDAYNTSDGSFGLLDTKLTPKAAGSWVSFSGGAKSIDFPLAAGGSKLVAFTVSVPANVAPGDHAGGLVISVTTASGQILIDRRVATRMYIRVPGVLQPALTVSNISASYSGSANPFSGSTMITFSVRNNGNVALSANMVVGAATYLGIPVADLVRKPLSELLPGSTQLVSITVPGVPQIGYLNPFVHLVPTIDKGALNPGPLREVDRDTVIFVMPWWILVALVLAVAVYLFLRIRRARDARAALAWIAYTEGEARRKASDESELADAAVSSDPVSAS